ncbi:hypothetical protein GIY62_14770 [Burkholderia plantarii]|uniref:hypothetical protein n=1 Tax=Burkholderia plantarii TaxID=41899 RepID=UPI00272D7523|nr:hypothetical protein [Burkholderia plantarii]WLE58390.1 hypothetical protein GIY62_14770 [Burkholderia plantarii]
MSTSSRPNQGSPLAANIPGPNAPFTDANFKATPAFWNFLFMLFRRTGGEGGGDGQLTVADVLGLEADIPLPFDTAHQILELSLGLQQAFAAISALQQAIPAFGEVYGGAVQAAVLPDVCGVPSAPAPLTEMTFART